MRPRAGAWRCGAAGLFSVLLAGCVPRSPASRALAAHGTKVQSLVRCAEVEVLEGFAPGHWQWRTVWLAPDRWAMTIVTSAEPDHYLYDGSVGRTFIGARAVATAGDPTAPIGTLGRFMGVAQLDALDWPGTVVGPLASDARPADLVTGFSLTLASGARYHLGLDAANRVVWAAGEAALPPLGRGTLAVRYEDFRRQGGALIPFTATYVLDGLVIARERARSVIVNDRTLSPDAFHDPAGLPACPHGFAPGAGLG